MARASTILSDRVAIPNEPDQWMRFRALPWHVLEEAKSRKFEQTLELARALPATDQPRSDADRTRAVERLAKELEEHPSNEYDQRTLLTGLDGHPGGIAEWSYAGPVDGMDLDPVTATWAADEIVRRSDPSKAAVGKGSSPSTAS